MFGHLREALKDGRFASNRLLMKVVHTWLAVRPKTLVQWHTQAHTTLEK
jgi:hypothetical protein